MSCNNCNCMDCRFNRSINDMGDESPIHRQRWQDAEPATESQAKAWDDCLDVLVQQFSPLNVASAVQLMADYFHVRPENYERLTLQFQKFIYENPKYGVLQTASGGIFKRKPAGGSDRSFVPQYIEMKPASNIPDMITGKLPDNCTCKGCGTGLNTSEKSCWKCGAAQ